MMTIISVLLLVSLSGFLSHEHELVDSFQINIERDSLSDAQISYMQRHGDGYKPITDDFQQDRFGNRYIACRRQNTTISSGFKSTEEKHSKRCISERLNFLQIGACASRFDATTGELISSCAEIQWPTPISESCDFTETSPNVFTCACFGNQCNRNMESEAILLLERYQASQNNGGHHKHSRSRKDASRARLHSAHSFQ